MPCYDCKYYTGEDFLACGVDPITAATSPEEGCREWEQNPNPWGFWEVLLNPPHVDSVQIGWVPINGWQELVCELFDEDEDDDQLEISLAIADYEAGDFLTFEEYDANRIS